MSSPYKHLQRQRCFQLETSSCDGISFYQLYYKIKKYDQFAKKYKYNLYFFTGSVYAMMASYFKVQQKQLARTLMAAALSKTELKVCISKDTLTSPMDEAKNIPALSLSDTLKFIENFISKVKSENELDSI